jgi:nucleoside-diphosphate-sugar epimerase
MNMNLANKTVAITGVGGFIGLRLAERCLQRGMKVRGLEVSALASARARAAGVDVRSGSVEDEAAMATLFAGVDIVVHTAATVAAGGDLEAFRKVNVEGTRATLSAARRAGVARFVHLSSVMVYGFRYPCLVDEDGPMRGEGSPYCTTKIESERVALGSDEPGRMRVTALRPGDVYGPGCRPWVVLPLEYMRAGQFVLPARGRGILNHLHVDNLVDAIFLCLERDVGGEAFNVTDGEATTCADFYARLARLIGQKPPLSAPTWLLFPFLGAIDTAHRVAFRERLELWDSVRYLARPYPYSTEKARRVLGYRPRVTLDEGMRELEEWLAASALSAIEPAPEASPAE